MCGICGIVRWRGDEADHRGRVERMTAKLTRRGPDDWGIYTSGRATFGATRLAIRGGASGRQPIHHRGVVVVCNGEIDNAKPLIDELGLAPKPGDRNDTWFLPHLYEERGEAFVQSLYGAFALALWDPHTAQLLLARDRVGERPLYYVQNAGELVFASELSALLAGLPHPPPVDLGALRAFAARGHIRPPQSPLSTVCKLAPADMLVVERGSHRRRRYWRWGLGTAPKRRPDASAFDRVFRRAVNRQIDGDVPYGVFLSGGIDSALVAAVARDLEPDRLIHSYTLRFGEPSYDEGMVARRVAARLHLCHHEVWVRAADFPRTLRALIASSGEPLADPAWIPTALLAERAAQDVKTVLVGEGGDEVFGGYPTYLGALAAGVYTKLPGLFRRGLRQVTRRWPPSERKVTLAFLLKRFTDAAELDPLARHLAWTAAVPPALAARLGLPAVPLRWPVAPGTVLDAIQRFDLEESLAEGLLVKADRAAMRSAVEPRAPFLDAGVLEFAETLPEDARVSGLRTKRFLKLYAGRYLSKSIVHRRKRGLSVPVAHWLRGELRDWAAGLLASGALDRVGIRTPVALELLDAHLARADDHSRPLWTLLTVVEWLRWYECKTQSAPVPTNRPAAPGGALVRPS